MGGGHLSIFTEEPIRHSAGHFYSTGGSSSPVDEDILPMPFIEAGKKKKVTISVTAED